MFIILAQRKTTKAGTTKRPPATKRTVQVKDCDNDDNIRAQDDQTLTGKIIVEDCPCEKRFSNASRLAVLSSAVATQLRAYFQQLYHTKVNYQVDVKVLTGDKTHTVFTYTVKVPQADHTKAKAALKETCKDEQVNYYIYLIE